MPHLIFASLFAALVAASISLTSGINAGLRAFIGCVFSLFAGSWGMYLLHL